MRRIARWLGYGLGVIVVLAMLGAGWIWFASARAVDRRYVALPEHLVALSPEQRADAPRLTRALGCFGCHGDGLRGRLMFDEPGVARVFAPNVSLVAHRMSDQQLAQAIRQGIAPDGRGLWVMPSGPFSRLSDAEVSAVISTIRALPAGGAIQPPVALAPLGRVGVALGKFKAAPDTIDDYRQKQPFYLGKAHEPGRQLASKICADCHGPDLRGQMPGFDKPPPDLRIAAAYSIDEFRRLLKTGRASGGRQVGLMSEVAKENFSALNDAEILALHGYLKARAERVAD